MSTDGVPGLVALVVVSLATLAIGTYGLRFSRTTSDFYVASRSRPPRPQRHARSAASTSPPRPSSASPRWC